MATTGADSGTGDRTLSVVIPTYERPNWLRRAVRSLARQVPVPTEVIAVLRDTDAPSHEAVEEMQRTLLPFPLRKGVVTKPGFMPPVEEGIRLAESDLIAVMDDDAEAEEGWVYGILRGYLDESVGAVGGRCINMEGERPVEMPETSRVGYVNLLGRFVGRMYMRPTFSMPRDVHFLMGGCMSFRRSVARKLEFDAALNQNVAFGYEVDLGLQVRAMRKRVIFDPSIVIRHYSAPRSLAGQRDPNDYGGVYWGAYNETRVAIRRLALGRAVVAVAWRLLVGDRRAPGIVPWIMGPGGRRLGFHTNVARPALAGILDAMRELVTEAFERR